MTEIARGKQKHGRQNRTNLGDLGREIDESAQFDEERDARTPDHRRHGGTVRVL